MKNIHLLFFVISITLAGCQGGDHSGPSGNPGGNGSGDGSSDADNDSGNTIPTSPRLDETIIPSGFNWKMQESKIVTFKLISNYSELNNTPLGIAGQHYIEFYSMDENNNMSSTPFLKTMTNNQGEAEVLLTLLNSWVGITIKATLPELVCVETFYTEQLTNIQPLGCNIVVESE